MFVFCFYCFDLILKIVYILHQPWCGDVKEPPHSTRKNYLEFVIYANYDNGLDVYQRWSLWEADKWALFQIDGINDPNLWRVATSMRFVRNRFWPMEEMLQAMPSNIDLFASQRY